MPNKCIGFHLGCICGSCQARYFMNHANSCTYGMNVGGLVDPFPVVVTVREP